MDNWQSKGYQSVIKFMLMSLSAVIKLNGLRQLLLYKYDSLASVLHGTDEMLILKAKQQNQRFKGHKLIISVR
jgi:hypothetical protein